MTSYFNSLISDCTFYDDDVIDSLLETSTEAFRGSDAAYLPSYNEGYFFPEGKPSLPVGKADVIDAEVGDDMCCISNNWRKLVHRIATLSDFLDLRISWKDTSINSGVGNYAESLVSIPHSYQETWLSQKSLRNDNCFGYIDVPKIRLILPVKNQRMVYSSTDVGKFSDMGNCVRWTPQNSCIHATTEIASLMQDALLGALTERFCAYLPQQFAGSGKPIPFSNHENFITFIKTWKSGTRAGLINTLMRETNSYLEKNMVTKTALPKVVEYFTQVEPVFYDWIKSEDVVTSIIAVSDLGPLEARAVGRMSHSDPGYWAYARLFSEKMLVSETQLKIGLQNNQMVNMITSCDSVNETKKILEDARRNWRDNNLFCYEKISSLDIPAGSDSLLGILLTVRKFFTRVDGFRLLKRSLREELVFLPEVLDEVYHNGPLCLKNLDFSLGGLNVNPSIRHVVDRENTEEYEHVRKLRDWVLNPVGNIPRDYIEDDNIIIDEVSKCQKPYICIVTDDIKLIRACSLYRPFILRVPVEMYYRFTYFGDGIDEFLRLNYPLGEWELILDTGSIQSKEEYLWRDGVMYPNGIPYGVIDYSKRWNKRPNALGKLVELDMDNVFTLPLGFPENFVYPRRRVLPWKEPMNS